MTMTLLTTLQEFCDRTGIPSPTVVISSTDDAIKQLRGLANEVIGDITKRGNSWPKLQKEGSFVTVPAELQTTILAAAPYGFKYLIQGSIFNRTARRPVFGPRGPAMWQQSEALPSNNPFNSYRIWQGNFYFQPAPPADQSIYFEYASDYAIQGPTSATNPALIYKKRFTADTDQFLLDEDLLLLGLRWKWKAEKGLRFVTEKQDYEAAVAQAIGEDGSKGPLDMGDSSSGDLRPGIFVPLGNWPL